MNPHLNALTVEDRPISEVKLNPRNSRSHSKAQIREIASSIEQYGFNDPVAVDEDGMLIEGHGRMEAAKLVGLTEIPTICLSHLSEAQKRAYVIAHNKIATKAGWDLDVLATELEWLVDSNFDYEATGFSVAEIDLTIEKSKRRNGKSRAESADVIPPMQAAAVSRSGDLWTLGRHSLFCGDARDGAAYEGVLNGAVADMIFTDPPYNVKIDGNVGGNGSVHHRPFPMASGEMSDGEYTQFLTVACHEMAAACRDGAIAYVCMDWRHLGALLSAGRLAFTEIKNICIWNKSNAGMGAFYRSKYENIFVYKVGTAPHVNNFGLGATGRPRSNVWDYAGISSLTADRAESLAMHPTVKPVALVKDAILDCSKPGGVILDPFGGSGTTLIAADLAGRTARLIEYDPLYCDTIIRRFETVTGVKAVLEGSDLTFDKVEDLRSKETGNA